MPVLLRDPAHKDVLEATIASVKTHSDNYELIIVDDGSPFATGFLKEEADTYIRHKKNMGIAPSWNDGIRVARAEYIVVINDDIIVPHQWLEKLAEGNLNGIRSPKNGYDGTSAYKWYPGYCFCLSRYVIEEKTGYFDEQFSPFNFEDLDYWTRALSEGVPMTRADFNIWHKEGDVLHKLDYDKVDSENKKKFIAKHGFDPIPYFFGDKDIRDVIVVQRTTGN
jgi:GT2 family glycosyltransferase